MAYRGEEQTFTDFSGGMKSNVSPHSLPINAAALVKNIVLKPGGGFRQRFGDTAFNSSAMTAGKGVVGLGYYKPISGVEYLMAICDTKIYKSEMDGTMDDITGAVVITTGDNNLWTFSQMNDLAIFVGGAPNPPIKWNATGNAAVLAGSPPSGKFGFQVNNRFFIGSTAANPSRIAWTILANPEDWSGTGSGTADIWTNDGDILTAAAVLSNDVVLLFKNNSIHQMIVRTAPFPIFPFIKNIGTAGVNCVTVVNGVAYFISSDGKFYATDGNTLTILPHDDIDDILSNLNISRLPYATSTYMQGNGYSHILFSVSSSSATKNDITIVWDIGNKCWLYHPTGFACDSYALTQQKVLYAGHYDGKIYKKDSSETTYTDASVSTGLIGGFWRWGWRDNKSFMYSSHPLKLTISYKTNTTGSVKMSYGFNYAADTITEDVPLTFVSGVWDSMLWDYGVWGPLDFGMKSIVLKGVGNTFQPTIYNSVSGQHFEMNGFSLAFRRAAQHDMQAT